MKKTLLLLAMIASTASFAGNMVKLSAESSRDFSDEQPTVPTVFATEVSMDKVAGTGLSFGGRLADSTDLYNLSLTKDTVLDGKVNLWAQYEAEVKGIKGSAKFSVDLDRKEENQGFKLFYDDTEKNNAVTEVKSTTKLAKSYAANENYDQKNDKNPGKKVEDYMGYKDIKDGKYKKYTIEKKGTFETSLSKDFMINDSAKLTGSFNTKTTFEFSKEFKPETVFTLGLDSKLNDGKLGLTLETDNNYKAPNGGFQYVSGKLSGGYNAFDTEAFIKYNFGKQTAVALNNDSPKTDRTDKLNELKIKAKLSELTDDKEDNNNTKYKTKYENENPKSLKDRIKDTSKELKLSDSAFLEDYVQAHSKYEKSGFSVEGKLKFSNALTNVAEYKVASSDANEIMLNNDNTHSMQEYMPELILNLGYKASNGMSVELNNDLTYKATVKTGYKEETKDDKKVLVLNEEANPTEHNLRYFGELKSGYTKDFASFAFETTNGVSAVINAKNIQVNGSAGTENKFVFSSAVVNLNSLESLTAKVTDKLNVTPSLDTTISVLFDRNFDYGFSGVRGVVTPKVALQYMPLDGLTLGTYVSSELNAEYDAKKGLENGVSSNIKQPTVKFGGSLQYNW